MSLRLPRHLDDAVHGAGLALQFPATRSLGVYRVDVLLRSAVARCKRTVNCAVASPRCTLAVAMRKRIAHGYDTVNDTIDFETVSMRFAALVVGLQRELGARPYTAAMPDKEVLRRLLALNLDRAQR